MKIALHVGDARQVLRRLPSESVDCVITSPPYWGLRDYGVPGQLGLERDPVRYVARLRSIFRQVRRVLKIDGTVWLNLGDCYATGGGRVGNCPGGGERGARWRGDFERIRDDKRAYRHKPGSSDGVVRRPMGPVTQPNRMPIRGLKPKDLVGIPWRVAFALQADGWYLRSDVIWHKPNPMPESVTDRPTKSHEYLFLLARSEVYRYDGEAIREASVTGDMRRPYGSPGANELDPRGRQGAGEPRAAAPENPMRNKRSVWTIATQPFAGAHFATFPSALIQPCILASCPPGGVVLDPFAGMATTGIEAVRHHRNAVLVELSDSYAIEAAARIRRELGLFVELDIQRHAGSLSDSPHVEGAKP